ncbi:hypothetical protein [Plantactinospora sp. KBS50]|uniref:globin domain-containing protein n=1 Tax=Plantactinospora sp. KBS50 TaxID=2024580 RepID=UPI000BAAAAA3|nr:hypothetical protein [Plantactinospora sp. KBS50]ASW56358.1 hypothetical protein CIK06_22670 [Plantactinospora sp. KBS50]
MSGTTSQAIAVRAAVRRFYRLVQLDQQLAPRFADADLTRLSESLSTSLIGALDGPDPVLPANLVDAHRRLGLSADDYDLLGHLLLTTLLPLRLGPDLLVRVGAGLTRARERVLG